MGGEGGGRGDEEGGDTCIRIADSCGCMADAITLLYSNYPPNKRKENP